MQGYTPVQADSQEGNVQDGSQREAEVADDLTNCLCPRPMIRVSLAELCRESQITQTKIEKDTDTFLSPESIRLEIAEKEPKIQTVQSEDFIFWARVKTSFENFEGCIRLKHPGTGNCEYP